MLDGIEHIAFYSEVFRDGERRSYLYPACLACILSRRDNSKVKSVITWSIISKQVSTPETRFSWGIL